MKAMMIAVLVAMFSTMAHAFGDGQVVMGMRSADFQAAPKTQAQSLVELAATVHTDPFWDEPMVTAGVGVAFDQMRGTLGDGLTDFSGINFGPEIVVRYQVARFVPFASVSYRLGNYSGHGTEDWSGEQPVGALLWGPDAKGAQPKHFATAGTHVALGSSWLVANKISVLGEFDWGFDRMETDTRVLNGNALYERRDTGFDSRSFLFGSQLNL